MLNIKRFIISYCENVETVKEPNAEKYHMIPNNSSAIRDRDTSSRNIASSRCTASTWHWNINRRKHGQYHLYSFRLCLFCQLTFFCFTAPTYTLSIHLRSLCPFSDSSLFAAQPFQSDFTEAPAEAIVPSTKHQAHDEYLKHLAICKRNTSTTETQLSRSFRRLKEDT